MASVHRSGTRGLRMAPSFEYERNEIERGARFVAGVDEVGRGALAGPVVAAAVVFDEEQCLGGVHGLPEGIRDSKLIAEAERERLYDQITATALVWAVGIADHTEVDRVNVLRASLSAMCAAVERLVIRPDAVLVDGRDTLEIDARCRAIVRGDATCVSIAAASILAKVTRDRIMRELHRSLPQFGWDRNKGYGTREHREAIALHGPSEHHRRTFLKRVELHRDGA